MKLSRACDARIFACLACVALAYNGGLRGQILAKPDEADTSVSSSIHTHTHTSLPPSNSTAISSHLNHGNHLHDRMMVTTAYWNVRSKRGGQEKSDAKYRRCMVDVMTLNTPMLIYGDSGGIAKMVQARGTHDPPLVGLVEVGLQDVGPCSMQWKELHTNEDKYTNEWDVPSVDLGCIWDAKLDLLRRSAEAHPEYTWHAWMDVCSRGRGGLPHSSSAWPAAERFLELPTDKVTVSYSGEDKCEDCQIGWEYCHCLAGTVFVVPGIMVEQVAAKFSDKVNECLDFFAPTHDAQAFICLSDQVILTKLFLDSPDMFFVSSSGYGAVAWSYLT
jgi:hypothetical protein